MDPREANLVPKESPRSLEVEKPKRFDTIIVFGQGPVKEIKLATELTPQEKSQWDEFTRNPRGELDPDFYAIDRESLTEEQRAKLQRLARFTLKRLGRLNALAAGYALATGQTKEVILSGGHTINKDLREKKKDQFFQEQVTDNPEFVTLSEAEQDRKFEAYLADNWPSEAELMKDIIVRRFSDEYRRKYGKKADIAKAIRLEDEATNTLENFAQTIDKNPDVFEKKIGLLGVNHHLRRILMLANRFTIDAQEADEISSQIELEERARKRAKGAYEKLLQTELPETVKLAKGELRWIRGLEDPQFITYWLGYVGEIKNPATVQRIIKRLSSPEWVQAIRSAFSQVGLDFSEFENEDLVELAKKAPDKFEEFRAKLVELTRPGKRVMPPEEA